MAHLKPITNGAIISSGTITMGGKVFGGYRLNADGTNLATILVKNNNSGGTVVVDAASTSTMAEFAPFETQTGTIYYEISGTNADAQLYEWISRISI